MSDAAALVTDNLDIWTGAIERKGGAGRGGGGKRISLYGIERLRALILDLAVRGKIVPQDAADGDAKEMLKAISGGQASQQRQRPSSPPFSIPPNWVWTTLGSLCDLPYGKNLPTKDLLEKGYPVFGANGIIGAYSEYHYDFPMLLISCRGAYSGKPNLSPENCFVTNNSIVCEFFRPDLCDYRCFYFFLTGMNKSPMISGSAQPQVTVAKAAPFPIPLPPLREQRRIVAKVDELMALCDALERERADALAAHQSLVETLLATLVDSADATDLADNWARLQSQFDTLFTTESSIDALKQTILDLAVRGKLVGRDPGNWPVEPLGNYVKNAAAGWSPKCIETPRTDDNWGVLKVSAVTWGRFQPEENKELPSSLEPRPEIEVAPGDFLISRANTAELVARSVVVPLNTPKKLMMSDKIIRFRFNDKIDPEYVNLVHASPFARAYYARVAGGTSSSMKNVSQAQIRALEIPIPTLAEQHRIVAKVDALMALCDQLKTRLADAAQTQRHLADAITERAAA